MGGRCRLLQLLCDSFGVITAGQHQAAFTCRYGGLNLRRHVVLALSIGGIALLLSGIAQQQTPAQHIMKIVLRCQRHRTGFEITIPPFIKIAATTQLDHTTGRISLRQSTFVQQTEFLSVRAGRGLFAQRQLFRVRHIDKTQFRALPGTFPDGHPFRRKRRQRIKTAVPQGRTGQLVAVRCTGFGDVITVQSQRRPGIGLGQIRH